MSKRLFITDKMLASEYLPEEAADLVAAIYEIDNSAEAVARLRQIPVQWGYLEALIYYDTEVNNGGHHQYFWNSQGVFLKLLEDGLAYYGAVEHLAIFRDALREYDPEQYKREYIEAEKDWKQAFCRGYDDDRFGELDDRYYGSDPRLDKVVENYIRTHLLDFRIAARRPR